MRAKKTYSPARCRWKCMVLVVYNFPILYAKPTTARKKNLWSKVSAQGANWYTEDWLRKAIPVISCVMWNVVIIFLFHTATSSSSNSGSSLFDLLTTTLRWDDEYTRGDATPSPNEVGPTFERKYQYFDHCSAHVHVHHCPCVVGRVFSISGRTYAGSNFASFQSVVNKTFRLATSQIPHKLTLPKSAEKNRQTGDWGVCPWLWLAAFVVKPSAGPRSLALDRPGSDRPHVCSPHCTESLSQAVHG